MTELDQAVEWLRDMRRVAGPHCDLATVLLDELYDQTQAGRDGEEALSDLDEIEKHLKDAPAAETFGGHEVPQAKTCADQVEWAAKQFDEWGELTGNVPWEDVAHDVTHRLDQWSEVLKVLQDAGIVAVGNTDIDMAAIVRMYAEPEGD